jgi:hypothetical protein
MLFWPKTKLNNLLERENPADMNLLIKERWNRIKERMKNFTIASCMEQVTS